MNTQLSQEGENEPEEVNGKEYEPNDTKVQHFIDSYQQSEELVDLKAEIDEAKNQAPADRDTSWRPLRLYSQVFSPFFYFLRRKRLTPSAT